MNLNGILTESTYDLSFTDPLYDFLVTSLSAVRKQNKVNRTYKITKFFPQEYNPFGREILLYTSRSLTQDTSSSLFPDKKRVVIYFRFNNRVENYSKTTLSRILDHEITHSLDMLKIKEYNVSEKRKELTDRNVKGGNDLPYRKDIFEFNVIINAIKKYKKLHPASYNSIRNYDDLLSKLDNAGFYDPHGKHLLKDVSFHNKLLHRLSRENLLPPNYPNVKEEKNTSDDTIIKLMRNYKKQFPNSWKLMTTKGKLDYVINKFDLPQKEKLGWLFNKTKGELIKDLRAQGLIPPYFEKIKT